MNKKEYQCKYNKNDLVYAKIRGYPWWPGIIGEIKLKPGENGEKKFELLVNFIGDHSHSMVNEDKLQKFHVKEIDFKNKKRKKLMQSIQIANDIHNGKYTYEEWRNKDRKKSMLQKKSRQVNGSKDKKSSLNDSNSEDGNSSDDHRESDGDDDEEYGPSTTSAKAPITNTTTQAVPAVTPTQASTAVSQPQASSTQNNQISQPSKPTRIPRKLASKPSGPGNGHQYNEIEEEDMPSKISSKLKSKRKSNKVIDDSEEEKVKLFSQGISDANHRSGAVFNANGLNSAKSHNNATHSHLLNAQSLHHHDPSNTSNTSSSSHQQSANSNSNSNFNNSNNNGAKNTSPNTNLPALNTSKSLKNEGLMVIETEDDEEEEGGAIPQSDSQYIRRFQGNSTEKQNKTSNTPSSKLDETLAKYQPYISQSAQSSEEKNKSAPASHKSDSASQNQSQKNQSLSLKKQQSLEQKSMSNSSNNDQMRNIRSKQSSFVSNQQQVIEEEDDNSECVDESSVLNSNEIKIEENEEDSKTTTNKNRLNNESSQIQEHTSDEEGDLDSENSNQRQTRASKRKQIKKSKNLNFLIRTDDKSALAKGTTGKSLPSPTANPSSTQSKKGRVTRSKTQNQNKKKIKGKGSSNGSSTSNNKANNLQRTRSTVKNKEPSVTIKNANDLINDLPPARTRKGSLRNQQSSTYYSESPVSHSSSHPSHGNQNHFTFNLSEDQILNLDDEFNQLFSHLQSMHSLDFTDTFKILEEIIQKIKFYQPKSENIVGILGSDNGKLLLCAKNLLFNDSSYSSSIQTSVSPQRINELREELDSLIEHLQDLLVKRFFDHEEKLRLIKTVNSNSSNNRDLQEIDQATQKTSPTGKKNDIENLAHQLSSSSSSSSVRPRNQSSSQQIKEQNINQPQSFSLQSKDTSIINLPNNATAEKEEPLVEQSLASLIQMQSEASLKMAQSLSLPEQHKMSSFVEQTNSANTNNLVSHSVGQYTLNTSQSYSLGPVESYETRPLRNQHSEQSYADKMIDEQSECRGDKESNIHNLTEDQKLMRRKICLKIIKPLNKILKDQAQAQNYAKNIEIMIRQKYPSMCSEYKNICKNLITLISSTEFKTTSVKIEEYLSSNVPESIIILQTNLSASSRHRSYGDSSSNHESLKNTVNLNDESNNSQHASRTPISRKLSTLSNRMEEEDNNRYDNSSESGVNHDAHNQSQSGEDKPAVFEDYICQKQSLQQSHQLQQQNKIIVDEEDDDDEEEVQVEIPQKLSNSMNHTPTKSLLQQSSRKSSLQQSSEKPSVAVALKEIKEDFIDKMEEEEEEEIVSAIPEQKKEEEVEVEVKKEEMKSPQKDSIPHHDFEDSDKIQVEDDDEEEEIGNSNPQQQKLIFHSSPAKNAEPHPQEKLEDAPLLNAQQSEPTDIQSNDKNYIYDREASELHQEIETVENKPSSIPKSPYQEIELEAHTSPKSRKVSEAYDFNNMIQVNPYSHQDKEESSRDEGQQVQEDAEKEVKTTAAITLNKDLNESSSIPLLSGDHLTTNTAPTLD